MAKYLQRDRVVCTVEGGNDYTGVITSLIPEPVYVVTSDVDGENRFALESDLVSCGLTLEPGQFYFVNSKSDDGRHSGWFEVCSVYERTDGFYCAMVSETTGKHFSVRRDELGALRGAEISPEPDEYDPFAEF